MIVFQASHSHVVNLAFSLDGRFLATVGGSRRLWNVHGLRLWNIQVKPDLIREWDIGDGFQPPLAFSPDGRFLASGGRESHVWDLGGQKELAAFRAGTRHVRGLTFTPDGTRLVTVSHDRRVRSWAAPHWTEETGYEWQIGKLTCVDASADGCRMAAGGSSGKVVVWDMD
jgi:WD40 repeat protein